TPTSLHSIVFVLSPTATRVIYTLSLHDALPILPGTAGRQGADRWPTGGQPLPDLRAGQTPASHAHRCAMKIAILSRNPNLYSTRSEEHTSELQSRENLVCRLLLEKKKQRK